MSAVLHNPVARYCIEVGFVPVDELRDDVRCPACDDLHRLMHLDPDVSEVLIREPWCEACKTSPESQTGDE